MVTTRSDLPHGVGRLEMFAVFGNETQSPMGSQHYLVNMRVEGSYRRILESQINELIAVDMATSLMVKTVDGSLLASEITLHFDTFKSSMFFEHQSTNRLKSCCSRKASSMDLTEWKQSNHLHRWSICDHGDRTLSKKTMTL